MAPKNLHFIKFPGDVDASGGGDTLGSQCTRAYWHVHFNLSEEEEKMIVLMLWLISAQYC